MLVLGKAAKVLSFGTGIIFVGVVLVLNEVVGIDVDVWGTIGPFFIIIVGVLIIAGILYKSRH